MHRLWPLYVVVFMGFLGYSIEIPIFTSLMLDPTYQFGNPAWGGKEREGLLGLMLGLYPFGQFLGSPILGAMSDRFGRKAVLLTSLALSFLSYGMLSFGLTHEIFPVILIFLFLSGLFEGNIAIAQGSIVDVTKDADRARYFGYIYVASSTAYILGPVLSSIFSNKEVVLWFRPETTFWVVTCLLGATFLWVFFHFKETHPIPFNKERGFFDEFTNWRQIFIDKRIRFYYGINFILYLAIFGFFRVYGIYMVEFYQVDVITLSLIVAYVSIPMIFMNMFVIKRLKKQTPKRFVEISATLMGIFMLSIVLIPYFYSIWVTLFLTTAAIAVTMTFSAAMISFRASKEEQGKVMGNNLSLQSGAQGISAAMGGMIATLATGAPLAFFGILGMLASLLLSQREEVQ